MEDGIQAFLAGMGILVIGFILGTVFPETERYDQNLRDEGYIKAYEDSLGKDIGPLVAQCHLDGGKPQVKNKSVLCVKEMK